MKKQYFVECHSKIASDCLQKGKSFENEEEALDWVENDCWVFSGEG